MFKKDHLIVAFVTGDFPGEGNYRQRWPFEQLGKACAVEHQGTGDLHGGVGSHRMIDDLCHLRAAVLGSKACRADIDAAIQAHAELPAQLSLAHVTLGAAAKSGIVAASIKGTSCAAIALPKK